MRSRNAKPLAALALTGIGSALVVGFKVPATADPASVGTTGAGSAATSGTGSTATGSGTSGSGGVATATKYADGTWTGSSVPEPWGDFQVQAVISGGKLTSVTLVSAPTDGHSNRINSQAVPLLTQSAIASQSAAVDQVSGATWTSQSYSTSLQSALDQAQAAANGGA